MNEITMVKYTAEQIDQILVLLASIVSDSKVYECSLPMMSVILDINSLLRNNAIVYDEILSKEEDMLENENDQDYIDCDYDNDEIILDGSDTDE